VTVLKSNFDYILFDSPPVLSVSDPLALAKHMDGAILVVQSRGTPLAAAQAGLERFSKIDANIYGVILNRVNIHDDGYCYYYRYHDYYHAKEKRHQDV
jgi:Mrp family chromosome partitioning ATPase